MATILIVEDEESIREGLRMTLELIGHQVLVAEDGLTALTLLQQGSLPDLLIVDLLMPRMSGIELVAELQRKSDWNSLPIIVTSGSVHGPPRSLPIGSYNTFLAKPFRVRDLLREIDTLVG